MQVPGVGNVLVQRLAAAGIRSIQEFMAADPRQLELVTTKLYPWGDTKREDARRLLPPPCSLDVELLGVLRNQYLALLHADGCKKEIQVNV